MAVWGPHFAKTQALTSTVGICGVVGGAGAGAGAGMGAGLVIGPLGAEGSDGLLTVPETVPVNVPSTVTEEGTAPGAEGTPGEVV